MLFDEDEKQSLQNKINQLNHEIEKTRQQIQEQKKEADTIPVCPFCFSKLHEDVETDATLDFCDKCDSCLFDRRSQPGAYFVQNTVTEVIECVRYDFW